MISILARRRRPLMVVRSLSFCFSYSYRWIMLVLLSLTCLQHASIWFIALSRSLYIDFMSLWHFQAQRTAFTFSSSLVLSLSFHSLISFYSSLDSCCAFSNCSPCICLSFFNDQSSPCDVSSLACRSSVIKRQSSIFSLHSSNWADRLRASFDFCWDICSDDSALVLNCDSSAIISSYAPRRERIVCYRRSISAWCLVRSQQVIPRSCCMKFSILLISNTSNSTSCLRREISSSCCRMTPSLLLRVIVRCSICLWSLRPSSSRRRQFSFSMDASCSTMRIFSYTCLVLPMLTYASCQKQPILSLASCSQCINSCISTVVYLKSLSLCWWWSCRSIFVSSVLRKTAFSEEYSISSWESAALVMRYWSVICSSSFLWRCRSQKVTLTNSSFSNSSCFSWAICSSRQTMMRMASQWSLRVCLGRLGSRFSLLFREWLIGSSCVARSSLRACICRQACWNCFSVSVQLPYLVCALSSSSLSFNLLMAMRYFSLREEGSLWSWSSMRPSQSILHAMRSTRDSISIQIRQLQSCGYIGPLDDWGKCGTLLPFEWCFALFYFFLDECSD